jgi:hypothetical protein
MRALPLLLAALLVPFAAPAWAAPVALVTDLRGAASINEGGKPRPAALLVYLEPGTTIRLDAASRMVLTYLSRPMEVLVTGPAEVTVGADGVNVVKGEKAVTRNLQAGRADVARQFEPVQRDRLALATVHMRSAGRPQITLEGPNNTSVYTATPSFSWSALPGVTSYRLTVMDLGGRTLVERAVNATAYSIVSPPLRHGVSYLWSVEAKLPSGEQLSAQGRFSVLDDALSRRIARSEPAKDASFSERVLFAAQLESEGLAYDAKRAWRSLAAERPDDITLREWAERP